MRRRRSHLDLIPEHFAGESAGELLEASPIKVCVGASRRSSTTVSKFNTTA
jgi:hypothetical protein